MSPALLIFWDVLDCACTLLRLAWRYARIVLTNVFLVHALFAYAACSRNMLTQVWYAFCCNAMLCIYHAVDFSTFVFRHSYVRTEVWSTHCWPVAIVPTGLQYFFCIGSKHNPQEFLTSRFRFSKARCGYIAVGNWDIGNRLYCRERLLAARFTPQRSRIVKPERATNPKPIIENIKKYKNIKIIKTENHQKHVILEGFSQNG